MPLHGILEVYFAIFFVKSRVIKRILHALSFQ